MNDPIPSSFKVDCYPYLSNTTTTSSSNDNDNTKSNPPLPPPPRKDYADYTSTPTSTSSSSSSSSSNGWPCFSTFDNNTGSSNSPSILNFLNGGDGDTGISIPEMFGVGSGLESGSDSGLGLGSRPGSVGGMNIERDFRRKRERGRMGFEEEDRIRPRDPGGSRSRIDLNTDGGGIGHSLEGGLDSVVSGSGLVVDGEGRGRAAGPDPWTYRAVPFDLKDVEEEGTMQPGTHSRGGGNEETEFHPGSIASPRHQSAATFPSPQTQNQTGQSHQSPRFFWDRPPSHDHDLSRSHGPTSFPEAEKLPRQPLIADCSVGSFEKALAICSIIHQQREAARRDSLQQAGKGGGFEGGGKRGGWGEQESRRPEEMMGRAEGTSRGSFQTDLGLESGSTPTPKSKSSTFSTLPSPSCFSGSMMLPPVIIPGKEAIRYPLSMDPSSMQCDNSASGESDNDQKRNHQHHQQQLWNRELNINAECDPRRGRDPPSTSQEPKSTFSSGNPSSSSTSYPVGMSTSTLFGHQFFPPTNGIDHRDGAVLGETDYMAFRGSGNGVEDLNGHVDAVVDDGVGDLGRDPSFLGRSMWNQSWADSTPGGSEDADMESPRPPRWGEPNVGTAKDILNLENVDIVLSPMKKGRGRPKPSDVKAKASAAFVIFPHFDPDEMRCLHQSSSNCSSASNTPSIQTVNQIILPSNSATGATGTESPSPLPLVNQDQDQDMLITSPESDEISPIEQQEPDDPKTNQAGPSTVGAVTPEEMEVDDLPDLGVEEGKPPRRKVLTQRKELNRIAAKRHREKSKEKMKMLEDRSVHLESMLKQYDSVMKKMQETLLRLQNENETLRRTNFNSIQHRKQHQFQEKDHSSSPASQPLSDPSPCPASTSTKLALELATTIDDPRSVERHPNGELGCEVHGECEGM